MDLSALFDHSCRLGQPFVTLVALQRPMLDHLIRDGYLSQVVALMTNLPSTAFLAFLSSFPLTSIPVTRGRFAAIMAVFRQAFFQLQIAQFLFEQLAFQFLNPLLFLFHLLLQFADSGLQPVNGFLHVGKGTLQCSGFFFSHAHSVSVFILSGKGS
ncbi:MAG: hypothetical protein NVS2B12_31420 [Ktedonobacteraceae bacterium]